MATFDTPLGVINTPRIPNFDKRNINVGGQEATFAATSIAIRKLKEDFFTSPELQEDDTSYKSIFNTGVYSVLKIVGGQYKDIETGEIIQYGGGVGNFLRIDNCLMTVSMTKNIVTTALNGRDGTIKECYSNGDYLINIRGSIVGEGNKYPENEVVELDNISRANTRLEIYSPILSRLGDEGIDNIVIDSITYNERAGYQNEQAFTITAMSDNDEIL